MLPSLRDTFEIRAVARVDLDRLTFGDKQRHTHRQSGLDRGWFGATGRGVTFVTGISLGHDEIDGDWELDVNRLTFVSQNIDRIFYLKIVQCVAKCRAIEHKLFK